MFDITAIDEATASKVAPHKATVRKPCRNEACSELSVVRSQFCQVHKDEYDALKVERYKGYRNLVRDAATAANKVETPDTDTDTAWLRISDGRSGFAYFAKDALPNYVLKEHGLGGMVLTIDGFAKAKAFGRVIHDSNVATVEGFTVTLMVVHTFS